MIEKEIEKLNDQLAELFKKAWQEGEKELFDELDEIEALAEKGELDKLEAPAEKGELDELETLAK